VTRLAEAVGVLARHEVARLRVCELGVVTSVFPNAGADRDHACAVKLRDTGLVLPRVPVAVGITGAASLPAVGDLVAVVFVGGDLHAPLIVGRLYHDALEPPEHAQDETVLRLPAGETDPASRVDVVVAAPSASERRLELVIDGSATVEVRLTPGEIALTAGDAEVRLRQPGGSAGAAIVRVGESEVVIDGQGDVSVSAAGTLTLKATNVKIEGQVSVKITGQTVDVN
jgi:phage baseplate assembly protein gpV